MNIYKTYLYLSLTVILLSGCVKRELEERPGEGYVEIALDWKSNAKPLEVCYLFYDDNGLLVNDTIGLADGIREKLPTGRYHVVAYSRDAVQVGYRGLELHDSAEVYAHEVQIGKASFGGYHILQPHSVYAASSCLEIGELLVERGATIHREAVPKALTKQIKFRFIIKNADDIVSLSGRLNGIVPSISLTTGKSNFSNIATISFTGIAAEENIYTIDIEVFDLLASRQMESDSNTMDITLEADGEMYDFNVDLTGTLKEIAGQNGGVIPIEVPVEVEITIQEINGGVTAIVTQWDDDGTGSGNPRPGKR